MTAKNRKPKIGDVIEIPVEGGCAYFQFTHEHKIPPHYGCLIRVCPGVYTQRPGDIADLVFRKPAFCVFVHLASLVKQPGVTNLGNFQIPVERSAFPIMKHGIDVPPTGKINNWWLFDGIESWPVGILPEEHHECPFLRIVNLPALVQKINEGYSPLREMEKYGTGRPFGDATKAHFADVIRRHNPGLLDE